MAAGSLNHGTAMPASTLTCRFSGLPPALQAPRSTAPMQSAAGCLSFLAGLFLRSAKDTGIFALTAVRS
jgi:hypothetical protein